MKLRILLLGTVLVLALASCSQGRSVPTDYGDTTRRNFTEGCETALTDEDSQDGSAASDPAQAQMVCGCIYEEISSPDGIPFERFKEINEEMEAAPTELPEDLRQTIERCAS